MISNEELVARARSFDAGPAVVFNGYVIDLDKDKPSDMRHWTIAWRGPNAWAIVQEGGEVLNKRGQWEYEPMNSHRTEAFIGRTRWSTAQEAFAFLEEWKPKAIKRALKRGYRWWHEYIAEYRAKQAQLSGDGER